MNKALTAIAKVIGVVVLWFVFACIVVANPALWLVAILIGIVVSISMIRT